MTTVWGESGDKENWENKRWFLFFPGLSKLMQTHFQLLTIFSPVVQKKRGLHAIQSLIEFCLQESNCKIL